jgi:hypothetical protein
MSAEDLLREHAMGAFLTDDVLRGLVGLGVDLRRLLDRWRGDPLLIPRLDRVVHLDRPGFEFSDYRPDEEHVGAMVFIVRNHIGDPIDLAAWSPPRPVALWCSRGAMLGAESLFASRMRDELAVFRDPLGWLRNLCRGVVVLDSIKAAPLLRRAEPLAAEDVAHGRELRKMLEVRPPRILVPAAEIERRAA